jgi:hypothetical protein
MVEGNGGGNTVLSVLKNPIEQVNDRSINFSSQVGSR